MLRIEEYGKENEKIIVMLHGAYFVHTYGRQYPLAKRYHIIVPHIMGFGDHTEKVFQMDECVAELAQYIKSLGKKVMLVGFSLGAQIAVRLVSEYEELFDCAIIVSPWLIKREDSLREAYQVNIKQLKQLKNKFFCHVIGMMNGLPPRARKQFVRQMQSVEEQTIYNVVYSGVSLETAPRFASVKIPIVALAGEREQPDVINSVKEMARINANCRCEIWKKAAHNIPPLFYKKFNELICKTY